MSNNALIGWRNNVETGLVRAGSELSNLPATNLQNGDGGLPWRSAADLSTWLEFDGGAGALWRLAGLFLTNLTTAATLRVTVDDRGEDVGLGTIWDSGWRPAGVVPGFGQAVVPLDEEVTGRFMRIDLNDPGNPDGAIQVGLAFAGPAWQPQANFEAGLRESLKDGHRRITTRGGQTATEERWEKRVGDLAFAWLDEDEAYDVAAALVRHGRRGGNALLLPFADQRLGQTAIYGEIEGGAITMPSTRRQRRGWRFTIEERL